MSEVFEMFRHSMERLRSYKAADTPDSKPVGFVFFLSTW